MRAEALAERALRRLESIGAAVEPGRPGEAFFAVEGLRGLYGTPELVLAKARRALGPPVRIGAGPNRLCAHAAARRMRARRPPLIVSERQAPRLIAGLPVRALGDRIGSSPRRGLGGLSAAAAQRVEEASLVDALERLGIRDARRARLAAGGGGVATASANSG